MNCLLNTGWDHYFRMRIFVAACVAALVHVAVFLWLNFQAPLTIIEAHAYSQPVQIRMRFAEAKPEVVELDPVIKDAAEVKVEIAEPEETPIEELQKEEIQQEAVPVVVQASLKRRIKPLYPRRSKRLGQEGKVWLRLLISVTGHVIDVQVTKPSPYSLLNKSALVAVRKWRFDPYLKNGKAYQNWIDVPIEFKLEEG